jgi:hypothetical protein
LPHNNAPGQRTVSSWIIREDSHPFKGAVPWNIKLTEQGSIAPSVDLPDDAPWRRNNQVTAEQPSRIKGESPAFNITPETDIDPGIKDCSLAISDSD